MDLIASWFSYFRVSFNSGAVATNMAEASERRLRLLRHDKVKKLVGTKCRNLSLLTSDPVALMPLYVLFSWPAPA